MAVDNNTIMASAWLEGTNDFQQRIPDPTITKMSEVSAALFDPMNRDLFNQWSSGLINRIGMTIAESKRFENPLAVFRKPDLGYGNTIQQIAIKWAKAHSFKDDKEDLLKYERPEFVSAFHTINRADKYKESLTRPEMRQALAGDGSSFGINQFFDMVTSAQTNAEQNDEMNIMIESLAIHDHYHGIFKHKLTAAPTDKATGQELLAAVKKYVYRFRFPSTLYNAQDIDGIPTFAKENECVLLVDSDVMSVLDVYAYAELFNMSEAEVRERVIMVPELPFANAQAILTTEDAFVCARSEYGIYPFFDPNTLTTHQILHAQGVYSINPFCPMILFTTDEATVVPKITQTVTGVEITAKGGNNIEKGGKLELEVKLEGSVTDNDYGIEVKPNAVRWSIAAESATGDPVQLNARTRVDKYGVLHCQASEIEEGTVLHVTGTTAYINPSGVTEEHTKTIDITVK